MVSRSQLRRDSGEEAGSGSAGVERRRRMGGCESVTLSTLLHVVDTFFIFYSLALINE
jgi:hypothetical protein